MQRAVVFGRKSFSLPLEKVRRRYLLDRLHKAAAGAFPSHMTPEADGREIAFKTLQLTFAGPHVRVPGRMNHS